MKTMQDHWEVEKTCHDSLSFHQWRWVLSFWGENGYKKLKFNCGQKWENGLVESRRLLYRLEYMYNSFGARSIKETFKWNVERKALNNLFN